MTRGRPSIDALENSSVTSPSCNTFKHDHLHPAVIATNRRENPFHAACTYTPCTHIYIYIYTKHGGRGEEGRTLRSCSHRHDLILLGQNLFGFLCARCAVRDASRRNQLFISLFYLFNVRLINARTESRAAPRCKLTRELCEREREGLKFHPLLNGRGRGRRVGQGRGMISGSS